MDLTNFQKNSKKFCLEFFSGHFKKTLFKLYPVGDARVGHQALHPLARVEEGLGMECVLAVPVRVLEGQSYQHRLAHLPIRERGMGLRSLVDTFPAAFLGSVEISLRFFTGEEVLCPPPGNHHRGGAPGRTRAADPVTR